VSLADLFDEVEREGRARCEGLEALGKLPSGWTTKHYPMTSRERRELRRLRAAGDLAGDVDVWVALCRGRAVPRYRLRAEVLRVLERWPA
jgi:hypothetical protein